jgi:hypothetical protein
MHGLDEPSRVAELGQLERIDPREVWKHEALSFTPWLAANAERLAEALEIDVEITGSEHPVGGFSLDLIGKDVTHDKPLIIENQLAGSDHSHLGQLLTYAAGTGAATIVWVATNIRDEHRQALTWLNEQTGQETHFFGVELEVVKIGDSPPAPLFNVVVMPNDWHKTVKAVAAASGASGKAPLYVEFWSKFLARLQEERPGWSKAKQGTQSNWFNMSVGLPTGCTVTASFAAGGKLRNEFYIDRATQDECKELFDSIHEQLAAFEAAYGSALSWHRLDSKKASRIAEYRDGTVENAEEHDDYIDWFINAGDRMRRALASVAIE